MQPTKSVELPPQATCYKPVHLYAIYFLKLNIPVNSFAACQRCGATSKKYTLQIGLVHSSATYASTLYVWVSFLQFTKMHIYFCKVDLDWKNKRYIRSKQVKDWELTVSRLFLSTFVLENKRNTPNIQKLFIKQSGFSPKLSISSLKTSAWPS